MITIHRLAREYGFALLLVLFSAVLLSGQEGMGVGRVTGTVADEKGAPVANAQIVAESLKSSARLTGTSDEKGRFALTGFGTGSWRITASKEGFEKDSLEMEVRQLAKNKVINLTLKKVGGVSVAGPDDAVRKDFEQATQLASDGRTVEAAAMFEDILSKHPEVAQAHLNAGLCDLQLEDMPRAKAHFQAVLDHVLRNGGTYEKEVALSGKALVGLGEIGLRSGDLETARADFSRALQLAPDDEATAYNVAEKFFAVPSVDDAIAFYEQALRIKKDWSKPLYKLGMAYLNKGNYAKALECLNRFIEVDPDNPQVPQAKGMIEAIRKIKS
jgi:tetratricopeptide (TPR) repeat protein